MERIYDYTHLPIFFHEYTAQNSALLFIDILFKIHTNFSRVILKKYPRYIHFWNIRVAIPRLYVLYFHTHILNKISYKVVLYLNILRDSVSFEYVSIAMKVTLSPNRSAVPPLWSPMSLTMLLIQILAFSVTYIATLNIDGSKSATMDCLFDFQLIIHPLILKKILVAEYLSRK